MFIQLVEKLDRLAQRLLGRGWVSSTPAKEVEAILRKMPGQLGVVVDCGANIGDWSAAVLAQRTPRRLIQIEPDEGNAEHLRKRFPNAIIVQAALSDHEGKAALYSNAPGSGLASLHQRDLRVFDIEMDALATIRTTTLEAVLKSLAIEKVDLLKLDIEGHELTALRAASSLFPRIKMIQFEFGGANIDSKSYFRDFWYLLSPHFSFFRISPIGLLPVDRYSEFDEVFVMTNYLCVAR